MTRRRVCLCDVCGCPIDGDDTVCPACLQELDRILGGGTEADEGEPVALDGDVARAWWIDREDSRQGPTGG